MRAKDFWKKFSAAMKEVEPEGYGKDWTDGIYKTLHKMQKEEGFWCQCAKHSEDEGTSTLGQKGERLNIDLMWFPSLAKNEDWIAPVVAIEHENLYKEIERSIDHWKVSQVAAPLRVFIGYVSTPDEIEHAAKILRDRERFWNAVEGGQSLIIMGHKEMNYGCLRGWLSPQGKMDWVELHGPAGECSDCRRVR